MTQDMTNIASFLVFLVTSLSQIFILCYFGDMIMRSVSGKIKRYLTNSVCLINYFVIFVCALLSDKRAQIY